MASVVTVHKIDVTTTSVAVTSARATPGVCRTLGVARALLKNKGSWNIEKYNFLVSWLLPVYITTNGIYMFKTGICEYFENVCNKFLHLKNVCIITCRKVICAWFKIRIENVCTDCIFNGKKCMSFCSQLLYNII